MADEARKSQDVIEILADIFLPAQVSQDVIEIAAPIPIEAVRSQDIVEILLDIEVPALISQNIIEIIRSPPDVSGVYFINVGKAERLDTYYGDRLVPDSPQVQKKIPDPTIRTALLGE